MYKQMTVTALAVLALTIGGCRESSSPTQPTQPTQPEEPQYLDTVLVTYISQQDLECNPDFSDSDTWIGCVLFSVDLYNPTPPDHGHCTAWMAPFSNICPDIFSNVTKVGPNTYQLELRNVYVNTDPEEPKHWISAGETLVGYPTDRNSFITGRNITIANSTDLEFRPVRCGNCVEEATEHLLFRIAQ